MALTFDEYQSLARTTAIYPRTAVLKPIDHETDETIDCNLAYPALGLSGEAGEVAEKVKKIIRDNHGHVTSNHRTALRKELGDALAKTLPATSYKLPVIPLTGDNALMIALAGWFGKNKKTKWQSLQAKANLRLDTPR